MKGVTDMEKDAEIIVNKYEQKYVVRLLSGYFNFSKEIMTVELKAKQIVRTREMTTFYDYYGCVSGSFRNDLILGWATKER